MCPVFDLKQFHAYSDPKRDPRGHTISMVFTALGKGDLRAASDAKNARAFDLEGLPEELAFDHKKILKDYFCFKTQKEPKW